MSRRAEAWAIIQALEPDRLLWGVYEDREEECGCACPVTHVAREFSPRQSRSEVSIVANVANALDITQTVVMSFIRDYDNACNEIAALDHPILSGEEMKTIAVERWPRYIPITDDQPWEGKTPFHDAPF